MGILYWIPVTIRMGGGNWVVAGLGWVLVSAVLGGFVGIFAWIIRPVIFSKRPVAVTSLYVGAAWTAVEYLRSAPWTIFGGFSWCQLGHAALGIGPVAQWVELGGVPLLSFVLMFCQSLLWQAWKTRSFKLVGIVVGLVAAFLSGGALRYHQIEAQLRPSLRVAILQGNIYQYDKWNREKFDSVLNSYQQLTEQAHTLAGSVMIYPESFYPSVLPKDQAQGILNSSFIFQPKKAYLMGLVLSDSEGFWNAAISLRDGNIQGLYAKTHLVPFGEYFPGKAIFFPIVRFLTGDPNPPVLNMIGGMTPGKELTPVETIKGKPAGVSICYEAIFPEISRALAANGAKWLVNLTNDGWYLDTAAPYQHFLMNIPRAIENRLPLARAANTGISAVINPLGEITTQMGLSQQGVLKGTLEELSSPPASFWRFLQALVPWACFLFTFITRIVKFWHG